MSDLIVPNIICFQTQKQLATLIISEYYFNVFWLIYVPINLCAQNPLCVHVACTLITMHTIFWALYQAPERQYLNIEKVNFAKLYRGCVTPEWLLCFTSSFKVSSLLEKQGTIFKSLFCTLIYTYLYNTQNNSPFKHCSSLFFEFITALFFAIHSGNSL